MAISNTSSRVRRPMNLWEKVDWKVVIDPATGALERIENRNDPQKMNWLREPGCWIGRDWIANEDPACVGQGGRWGLVETPQTGLLHVARVTPLGEDAWESVYVSSVLTVTIRREIKEDGLHESVKFLNTGPLYLDYPVGSLGITAPLFDQYPDAVRCLTSRCHAHLWMGGSSAWICALRMSGKAPHLGLVITQGALDAYSQRGATMSDRGQFVLHPSALRLAPSESTTIAWRLFWHNGWEDFWANLRRSPGFVRLSASRYVVPQGDLLEINADSDEWLSRAHLRVDGREIENGTESRRHRLEIAIPTTECGEITVDYVQEERRTWLRAIVVPPLDELIAARVRFIVRRQQRNAPGDPLDGAYLLFDNETGEQVYHAYPDDHNAGRERFAMGVLGALYWSNCADADFRAELVRSLGRHAAFVCRELVDEDGVVYGTVGRRDPGRLYNYPWAAHFHLAMYRTNGVKAELTRAVSVLRSYYQRGGAKFYPVGMPVGAILQALGSAGMVMEHAEVLAFFRDHADAIVRTGLDFPSSEVNFEQSIVGPAAQILLEVFLATRDEKYLKAAREILPVLELFAGRQPDHRLYEVSIRHWDDYWFGRLRRYGDTFPHYWSSLNGIVFALYAVATGESKWATRAQEAIDGTFSLFTPDGQGSCAHVYPLFCDGKPGARNDPWANDQDWALVNALQVREILAGHRD